MFSRRALCDFKFWSIDFRDNQMDDVMHNEMAIYSNPPFFLGLNRSFVFRITSRDNAMHLAIGYS